MTGEKVANRLIADVTWFDAKAKTVDWHATELPISCLLAAPHSRKNEIVTGNDLFLLMNPEMEAVSFTIPQSVTRKNWHLLVNTAATSPNDLYSDMMGPPLEQAILELPPKSMIVFVAEA